MQCPKCGTEQQDKNLECVACGIIFKKYLEIQQKREAALAETETCEDESPKFVVYDDETRSFLKYAKTLFLYVKPEGNPLIVWARVSFFLVIFLWAFKFIFTPFPSNYAMESVWHVVNLPFHEAGHIIFKPFGRFIASLGGSLGQLLMPLICMIVFLVRTQDTFAASFSLWWLGENFMDLAPYINDAKALVMPLVGGNTGRTSPYGFHDWEFILRESGLINSYYGIACTSHGIGIVLMIVSIIWGGYVLYKQLGHIGFMSKSG